MSEEADRLRGELEKLAEQTAKRAAKIANRRNITRASKAERLAALMNTNRARAAAIGEASMMRQLEALTGRATVAKGLLPRDDSERLLQAAQTALEDRKTALDRMDLLVRSEVFGAGQSAVTDATEGRKQKRGEWLGYVRHLNPGACEVCKRWYRRGRVWPPTHYMPRHPNCRCTPRFVLSKKKPRPVRRRKAKQ